MGTSWKRETRLTQEDELQATRRRYVVTTDANHEEPIALSLLDRRFAMESAEPDQFRVSDITHIPTGGGWLLLAVVLDLATPASGGMGRVGRGCGA